MVTRITCLKYYITLQPSQHNLNSSPSTCMLCVFGKLLILSESLCLRTSGMITPATKMDSNYTQRWNSANKSWSYYSPWKKICLETSVKHLSFFLYHSIAKMELVLIQSKNSLAKHLMGSADEVKYALSVCEFLSHLWKCGFYPCPNDGDDTITTWSHLLCIEDFSPAGCRNCAV